MKILRFPKKTPAFHNFNIGHFKVLSSGSGSEFFFDQEKMDVFWEILDILISSSVVYALLLQSISIAFSLWILTDSLN